MIRAGFTLVELSIVIVIIGLIIGGITAGQSMVRQAELRSVITDIDKYSTSINTFKSKYLALPGDMANATDFWGAQHATPATCYTTASTSALTCNGNGNGIISTADGGTTSSEMFRAWQHLANAGLIEGTFNGVASTGGTAYAVIGTNVPASKVSGGGYTLAGWSYNYAGDSNLFAANYGHIILFGAQYTNYETEGPLLTPQDAWSMDTKIDDGKPAYGKVKSFKQGSSMTPSCLTTAVETTSAYAVTTSGQLCSLIFSLGF